MEKPLVGIVMGSKSDLPLLEGAFKVLDEFGVPYTARVMSAHRTPAKAMEFASTAEANGLKVIICAAGMAAHLAGVMAAHTVLPVLGIPVASEPFNGLDALLATVQMPPGIPVGTVTVGKSGAKNAALLAVSILSLSDADLRIRLHNFRKAQTAQVEAADADLQASLSK